MARASFTHYITDDSALGGMEIEKFGLGVLGLEEQEITVAQIPCFMRMMVVLQIEHKSHLILATG